MQQYPPSVGPLEVQLHLFRAVVLILPTGPPSISLNYIWHVLQQFQTTIQVAFVICGPANGQSCLVQY